jgi:hypothetical protein
MKKKMFSINQKLLVWGVLVTFILGVANILTTIYIAKNFSNKQIVLKQEYDKISAKIGNFTNLTAEEITGRISMTNIVNFPVKCTDGYAISFINFSGGYTECIRVIPPLNESS